MKEEVQTRNADSELKFFGTIGGAFTHSKTDPTVWKISFSFAGERVRLVRHLGSDAWEYEPILLSEEAVSC